MRLAGQFDVVQWPTPTAGGFLQSDLAITGSFTFPQATGMQLSVGGVLEDFGDWIKTTAGEVLRVVVDQFGRRIVQKTGEVLSNTPLGPATAYSYARNQVDKTPLLLGAGVLILALLMRR